jgi:hypothetical protein
MSLTTDPNDPNLRAIEPSGQQKSYLVLSDDERAKGFVVPVRRSYRHLKCGGTTSMGTALCETYARDPRFYGGTFCCTCGAHFRLREFNSATSEWEPAFLWSEDGTPVGADADEAAAFLAEKKAREATKNNGGGI